MARVMLAQDLELDRPVAIKWILAALIDHETAGRRFLNEARFLGSVEHPNLLRVFGCVEGPKGELGLVMEYVEGSDLQRELGRRGRLAPDEVRAVGVQVAGALAALHQKNIFHRDLKPANLMRRQDDGRVVVMDLGLASSSEVTRMTQTGYVVGTLLYMAPEVVRGEPYTAAADVYQLGATLFELATGVPLIPSGDVQRAVDDLLAGKRPAVSPVELGIPPGLWRAIEAAIDVDPARRPASAEAFAAALEAMDLGAPVARAPALPSAELAVSVRPAGRARPPVALALAGLGLLVGLGVWGAGEGPPRDARWRVVGEAVVVEVVGGPEDLRVEVDGEAAAARFEAHEGRRRAVVTGIASDRDQGLRLVWDGGAGPIQHLRGEPEALGTLELGGPGLLRVHARRPCEVGFGPEGARLWALTPGRHPLPAPDRDGASFWLRWVEDGVPRRREVPWAEFFTRQAERLAEEFSGVDVQDALVDASVRGEAVSFATERARWEPALPWLPEVLARPDVPVALRRRLLRVFQVWQRSVAGERVLGLEASSLALPSEGPGGRLAIRVGDDDPEEPPPLAGQPVIFDPGECRVDPTSPGHFMLATEYTRHVPLGDYSGACQGITWRWPDAGGSGLARLWVRTPRLASRAVLRLRLVDAPGDLQVEFLRPEEEIAEDDESFRGWLGVTLPMDLWPRPGQLVSLELVDLLRPQMTVAKVWKIRLDPAPGS